MQGLVLTDATSPAELVGHLRSNHIPLLKVITAWGLHWDSATIAQVTQIPSFIVRTKNGDGCTNPPDGEQYIFLHPETVLAELKPWMAIRPRAVVELGNEPNNFNPSDDAAWTFRYWFEQTVNAVRQTYPGARILAPGLIENRQSEWWNICRDVFNLADGIGFHAYAWHDFIPGDTGQIERALHQLHQYFPDKAWFGTEIGINDTGTSPNVKADRYCALHTKLPSQVAAACWYHICSHPSNPDQHAYALPVSAWSHLKAGGTLA